MIDTTSWNADCEALLLFAAEDHGPHARRLQAAWTLFGLTEARYHLALRRILDMPEATKHSPALVRRLRAKNAERAAARSARRLA